MQDFHALLEGVMSSEFSMEILIHGPCFTNNERVHDVFRDAIPGQKFAVGRKLSIPALDIFYEVVKFLAGP